MSRTEQVQTRPGRLPSMTEAIFPVLIRSDANVVARSLTRFLSITRPHPHNKSFSSEVKLHGAYLPRPIASVEDWILQLESTFESAKCRAAITSRLSVAMEARVIFAPHKCSKGSSGSADSLVSSVDRFAGQESSVRIWWLDTRAIARQVAVPQTVALALAKERSTCPVASCS